VTRKPPRTWSPRAWQGMDCRTFARFVWRHRGAIHPALLPIAVADGLVSLLNSALGGLEAALHGDAIRRQPQVTDPVFIIGHWRSGTTLLHELLALDPGLAAPTIRECFSPHHFLLNGGRAPRWAGLLVPERRPMDDMRIDLTSPAEDEFALCLLGARSPYETIAFPNRGPMRPEMFDPAEFPAAERERWRSAFTTFLKRLALARPGRRILLKSPPHTCRIRTLLDLCPDAAFIHIVRDPLEVFPSMLHTWRSMFRAHGWQRFHGRGLEDMVLDIHEYMFDAFERDRGVIPEGRLQEVRYEELVADPAGLVDRLRRGLGLTQPDTLEDRVSRYFAERHDFRPNRLQMDPAAAARVRDRWGPVARRYGYWTATSSGGAAA